MEKPKKGEHDYHGGEKRVDGSCEKRTRAPFGALLGDEVRVPATSYDTPLREGRRGPWELLVVYGVVPVLLQDLPLSPGIVPVLGHVRHDVDCSNYCAAPLHGQSESNVLGVWTDGLLAVVRKGRGETRVLAQGRAI